MKRTPTSRTEAAIIAQKRLRSAEFGSEERLQMEIVRSFADKFSEKRGRLFATFQNPTPEQHGLWVSKGMVKGVADLIWIDNENRIVGIEVKHPEMEHHRSTLIDQANWLINNCYRGYFCTSVEMFWRILDGGDGIDPKKVLKYVDKSSTVKFKMLDL